LSRPSPLTPAARPQSSVCRFVALVSPPVQSHSSPHQTVYAPSYPAASSCCCTSIHFAPSSQRHPRLRRCFFISFVLDHDQSAAQLDWRARSPAGLQATTTGRDIERIGLLWELDGSDRKGVFGGWKEQRRGESSSILLGSSFQDPETPGRIDILRHGTDPAVLFRHPNHISLVFTITTIVRCIESRAFGEMLCCAMRLVTTGSRSAAMNGRAGGWGGVVCCLVSTGSGADFGPTHRIPPRWTDAPFFFKRPAFSLSFFPRHGSISPTTHHYHYYHSTPLRTALNITLI
jgi:hypothetical protein